ncbi:MAG: hypothetical protein CVV49_19030 [Spirochaetae bacterium HGW-Spirochaetae-5]|nr:MAG: hypothetical protein CVV49_19030 [Spirochaetae bacterium HGW-Spirochaetae-5]
MIMKNLAIVILFMFLCSTGLYSQHYDDLQEKHINNDRLKLFPSTGKNYFFLLSVNDKTQIVIGDLTRSDKKIILINLNKDYTTIQNVVEYNPVTKQLSTRKDSNSKFFTTDIVKLKKDIITGAVFKGNNTDEMKSFGDLESVFKENDASKIFADVYGFSVKLTEVDEINKILAMYTFGNHIVYGYYLQFKTFYYRENPTSIVKPKLKYSVYSKHTQDPVIIEFVENLFKIRKPSARFVE